MIRSVLPVDLRVQGRDGRLRVWVRPLSARQQLRYERDVERAAKADDDLLALLEIYLVTLREQIDRVETEGEDWAPYPDGDAARIEWLDALGTNAVHALMLATIQRLEEGDDGLGESMNTPRSPRREGSSATSAPTTSGLNGDAASRSLIPCSAPSETLWSRVARWIWRCLPGTGARSRTADSSTTAR